MMITFVFILIATITILGIQHDRLKETALLYIIAGIYFASLISSVNIPYIIDDLDHLFDLSSAMQSSSVFSWIMTPHNEHAIPFLKLIYFIFYKVFMFQPQPFHLLIIATCVAIVILIYKLILQLTNSPIAALIGICVFASSNLLDLSCFVITNSHVLFCLFFLLLLFYSLYKYHSSQNHLWTGMLLLSLILAPWTFSLGLMSIVFAILFEHLCISKESRRTKSGSFFIIVIGWLLGALPYIFSAGKIIYAKHYLDVGATSSLEIANITTATRYFFYYIIDKLIPFLLPHLYFSMGLFFFIIVLIYKYRKSIEWKKVAFFLSFGLLPTLVIYIFRMKWGPMGLSYSRYDVFPVAMMSLAYPLILHPYLTDKQTALASQKNKTILCILCFSVLVVGGSIRYIRGQNITEETTSTVQAFYEKLYYSFSSYLHDKNPTEKIAIKDVPVPPFRLASLTTKAGYVLDVNRYPRRLSFYAQFVLKPEIRNKIVWGKTTDRTLLKYLIDPSHKNRYYMIYDLLSFPIRP